MLTMLSPFVQRVWIALEFKGLQYQYVEVDPYKKPQALLEVNPRGLVPALRHGDWGCGESTVLMDYVSHDPASGGCDCSNNYSWRILLWELLFCLKTTLN